MSDPLLETHVLVILYGKFLGGQQVLLSGASSC